MAQRSALFVRKQSGGMFAVVDETKGTGNVWFVDSGSATGSDAVGYGQNPDMPFLTWDYAVGQCTASNGDTIYLMPGHAETLTTASDVTLDVIGVTTIGLGEGSARPTFTFGSTDNTASIRITAASNKIKNILCVCNDDALTSGIDVRAADCEIDVTWRDQTDIEAASAIVTTAAADRLKIKLKYEGYTGGNAAVSAIALVGVNEGDITVDAYGKWSTSVVDMLTTLSSGIRIRGYFYNSGTTDFTKNVTANVASCLWFATGYDGAAGGSFSGGSAAAIAGDDVSVVDSRVSSVGIQTSAVASQAASVGLQTSTVQSKVDSAGLTASTVSSKVDSAGLTASTGNSKADSVGLTASTGNSKADSVGISVSTATSTAASVGIQTSTVNSKADSIGTVASTGPSIAISKTDSMWLAISAELSLIRSKQG